MRDYDRFIITRRMRASSVKRSRKIDQFYSDRSRIIYSSSFRRLQQKAQVFSLEPNSSVRTRLTHSLEVADLGRTLANQIGFALKNDKLLTENNILALVSIVENACLLHDIGNPPFGHFGETAIREWANDSIRDSLPETIKLELDNAESLLNLLINDFKEFDGNPQGFRIVTKLHPDYDEYSLNLTFSTLLCIIKYPRTTGEKDKALRFKKAGYFQTEQDLVNSIYESVEIKNNNRYPFVYIMEAADDIAYCMSDIADGIEKGIITEKAFIDAFHKEWNKKYEGIKLPVTLPKDGELKGFKRDISIPWSLKAMKEAVECFKIFNKEIYEGTAVSLISKSNDMGKVLDTIKSVSRSILYTSFKAESIEITGYAVITGILNKYRCILKMEYEDFYKLITNEGEIKGFDFEKRLLHRIGKRYIEAYNFDVGKIKVNNNVNNNVNEFLIKEWWLRAHLIIDHISGMTDEFALETYQMLEGIQLMR